MKKIKKYTIIAMGLLTLNSCNNWLDILPENEQAQEIYWSTKEEAEAVLNSGYYYLSKAVPNLIQWGELRGGSIYKNSSNHLQSFTLVPTDKDFCNWESLYFIINMANAVLKNVDAVLESDRTFNMAQANSLKAEAYFLRGLSYFYLVRNWREVPLVLIPYEDDQLSYSLPKSPEAEVLSQIKKDISAAIATGAAKEAFEGEWETKGRATIWALYALLADVNLWSGDYAGAVSACDAILKATSPHRPAFMQGTTEDTKWYKIFNPGLSNESIFELYFDYQKNKDLKWHGTLFGTSSPSYYYSSQMLKDFIEETNETGGINSSVRDMYGACTVSDPELYTEANTGYIWKYNGTEDSRGTRPVDTDYPHFIIYRVAEIKLIKAEALVMQGTEHYADAIKEIDEIRVRANLPKLDESVTVNPSEDALLMQILQERNMELAAEGKRWYDLLRFGRCENNKYRNEFINLVIQYNETANPSWIRSVLRNDDALFLPIWSTELENNTLLVQNPYYE